MCITIGALPWQWPRTTVNGRGSCCGWTSEKTAVAIAADFRGLPWCLPRYRGNCRGWPWQLPRTSVSCHGWYDGVCHRENRSTGSGHNRGICRGIAMSCGTCRGNPRISTLASGNTGGSSRNFRGHCADLRQKVK